MPRVLLVDDAEDVHALFRAIVRRSRRADLEIISALDGQQALDLLAAESFDLVLTDLNMPRMGGGEMLDRMRVGGDATPVAIIGGLIVEKHPLACAHLQKSELLSAPVEAIDRLLGT